MEPIVTKETEDKGVLSFTLQQANVSIANALRRTMLSNIPCVVFRTAPYAENRADIKVNTSRMNNELFKQRLSCVPIHISDPSFPIQNYQVELDVTNNTDSVIYATTKDFKIKDLQGDVYVSEAETRKIFPPDPITGDYISLLRLRQRLSDEIPGQQISMVATLDIGRASEDGAFNVVSCATYGATPDPIAARDAWQAKEKELLSEGKDPSDVEFAKQDWMLLDAQRYITPDSFDFQVETVGQFTNRDIVFRAAHILIDGVKRFKNTLSETQETMIAATAATLENGYDIQLEGEGYTLGKALEYVLYIRHFQASPKVLSFCGFLKEHPHIDSSMIRLGFINPTERSTVYEYLVEAADELERIYTKIAAAFKDSQ